MRSCMVVVVVSSPSCCDLWVPSAGVGCGKKMPTMAHINPIHTSLDWSGWIITLIEQSRSTITPNML